MFEQYTDKELAKPSLLGGNSDMFDELECRRIANKYKNMGDEELEDLIDKIHTDIFEAHQGTSGKVNMGFINTSSISLELHRREFKRKGVAELPIEIVYSDEE